MRRLPRSYLYVPGTDTKRMAKALTVGTDAIILDLEDAVPAHLKADGRDTVRRWLVGLDGPAPDVWVRVNSGKDSLEDIDALRDCPHLTGFVLAKAELPDVRRAVEELVGTGLELVPLLETAAAVLDVREIASAGVQHVQIGEYDLCADVGITPGDREDETAWARAQVVFASRDAGLMPPVAPVSIEIRDEMRFEESTRLAARQGFVGRTYIHPRQVEVVNRVYTPTEEALASAQETLDRFEALDDRAVMVDDHGRLVDEATVRSARRTLALGEVAASRRAS
jgi:citrate lyase subunit beta / citryl-CoA lyase